MTMARRQPPIPSDADGDTTGSTTVPVARPGDVAPEFALSNAAGKHALPNDGASSAPLVVLFYRDGACPVCKTALRAYQRRLPTFTAAGARVIAISPETREAALVTARESRLDFEFLSDADGTIAGRFGIAYDFVGAPQDRMPENPHAEIPVPASFIISAARQVIAAPDETRGLLDPDEVVATLRQMAAG